MPWYVILALSIAVLITVLLIVIATRPAAFTITRSLRISATPATVYGKVADFHAWLAWSPWEGLDPNLKRTYGGTAGAVGESYAWEGDSKVGAGSMTITETRLGERLGISIAFLRPMVATNQIVFTFAADGDGTTVTWTMTGTNNFMGKAFALFVDLDKLVGGDFAKGLAKLKTVCETSK